VEIILGGKKFDASPIETIDVDPPNLRPIGSGLLKIVLDFGDVVQGWGYGTLS